MKFTRLFLVVFCVIYSFYGYAQGTWSVLNNWAPDSNGGNMLLLSDGRILAKTGAGGGDGIGNIWNILTPDSNGSYINGTWSTVTQMHDTRLYYSSQVLKDGRVYVAGGEYGTGFASSEIYDPVTNIWTLTPVSGDTFYDANSNILPDGRVLQQLIMGNYLQNAIFDPVTASYSATGNCHYYTSESSWLQLPDGSVLFIDLESKSSERFIPSLNKWVVDAVVPDSIWKNYETGGSLLLPDGRAFFFGAGGHTAYYTPSGNSSPGSWIAGPDFPNGNGTADAPAANMVNGKVLCMAAPKPINDTTVFLWPTTFYEFDYKADSFAQIPAPPGLDTNVPNYLFNMLELPNGSIMLSELGSYQYYIYTPSGTPIASGKPSIDSLAMISCGTYRITGELFNGLSQGVTYNDDFQAASNYPIIRLTSGSKVYYARTFNWNRTSVMTDSLEDTAYFTLPAGLPNGTYSLVVTANGISSNPVSFTPCVSGVREIQQKGDVSIYPNPSKGKFTLQVSGNNIPSIMAIYNVLGELVYQSEIRKNNTELDISNEPAGAYMYKLYDKEGKFLETGKLIIQ